MKFSFHPDAEIEFNEAVTYYETCEKGLGYEFSLEVYEAINRVIAYPFAWQLMDATIRRSLVNRIPFGILYVIENSEVIILAVMHLHRKPNYWAKRK